MAEAGDSMANGSRRVKGGTPLEHITGDAPDTSEFMDFGFHDCVQFRENAGLGLPPVGRWLSCWVLPKSGIQVSATTAQRVTKLERQTNEMKQKSSNIEESVKSRWEAAADCQLDSNDPKTSSLELEDEESKDEFKRTIQPSDLEVN